MTPEHRAEYESRLKETGGNVEQALQFAVQEIARYKAGDFFPDEIQEFCHKIAAKVPAQEFANACAAYQRSLYGYAPDRDTGPNVPLIVYMQARTRLERSAAFLRTYAKRLLDKTAPSWEIPNTVASTLTDIADLLDHQQKLRDKTQDSTLEELRKIQKLPFIPPDIAKTLDAVAEELIDWDRSFALYHKAIMALTGAYKAAHPEIPDLVYPDTSTLCVWAAEEIESLRARKDAAYEERNRVVAALSKLWPAHKARHPEEDAIWERDWMTIICVHSPAGQLTWHVHDSQVHLFTHLPEGENHWDGHDTEEKYLRLQEIIAVHWTPAGPGDIRTIRRALMDYTDNRPDGSRWARRNEHIDDARALLKAMPVVPVGYPPEERT